jgi:hypothetical protein
MRYTKHYSREEASALLPQVKRWLARLLELRAELEKADKRLASLLAPGCDIGGNLVNSWVRGLVQFQELLFEFHTREIQVKDLERGLIDFPAMIGGKEVFLCWENGEDDVEFWHDLDAGYAGRERL